MKVAFRADASLQIGTGHVMRCLTLADELTRQGAECWFICREHTGHLGELIASKGHHLALLPRDSNIQPVDTPASESYAYWLGASWQEDARQTRMALGSLKPDWLVVDHYALDAEWERVLAGEVGNIMVIDDLANRSHQCTLLLDQNLGRASTDYDDRVPPNCHRLIGPRYALLRPEFAALREQSLKRRETPRLKRILISLGGVDRLNVTTQILDAIRQSSLPDDVELDIIMGATAPHLDGVRRRAADLSCVASVSVNVTNMAERMSQADLSIGAAGGTSWERCSLGLPVILVVLAENQIGGAKALETVGAAVTINAASQINKQLPQTLTRLTDASVLKSMSRAAAAITRGAGVSDVIQTMNAIAREH